MSGKHLSDVMNEKMKKDVEKLKSKSVTPGLAVILIGTDPASQTYVRNKEKRAEKLGIYSVVEKYSEEITEKALLKAINRLNADKSIHGILVQLPLPRHIDENSVLMAINPAKDVDGFHPVNMGKLFAGHPDRIPCTPYGIMKMLDYYGVQTEGKNAVVIGRSNIVGKPMAQLLMMNNATVTMAHSKTRNLQELTQQADIVVSAIGKGHFITKEFIKPGAAVIDVGMNRNTNGKLIGDVNTDEVKEIAGFLTPVPKGVGPMTITMLMYQTIKSASESAGIELN
ncbi:MAG: bifunctional methylenetetrahydrofolate dehydrogenase/methenyltetrahydrofolate cyclohydrolase FolD [Pisciglobus halotolerans]|nr:bifunctional methylenetetrahydrofolate dehydrogenase/methenyltetrahydrofolate cyclohydrolase FolD [Pisciglobus halotolerans]